MTPEVKMKSENLNCMRHLTDSSITITNITINIIITNTIIMITSPPSLSSLALATSSRPEVNSAVTLISFWYSARRR